MTVDGVIMNKPKIIGDHGTYLITVRNKDLFGCYFCVVQMVNSYPQIAVTNFLGVEHVGNKVTLGSGAGDILSIETETTREGGRVSLVLSREGWETEIDYAIGYNIKTNMRINR